MPHGNNHNHHAKKKKKIKCCPPLQKIIKPEINQSSAGSSFCESDICGIQPPPSSPISTTQSIYARFTASQQTFKNTSSCPPQKPQGLLADLLPDDFYGALQDAAKKGILLSFLSTLTEAAVTDILKPRGFKEDHIEWINQVLKACILICGGMSIGKTIAPSLMNLILTKRLGIKKETANHLTLASAIFFDVLANPLTLPKMLTIATVVPASLATGWLTELFYHKGRGLKEETVFATTKPEETSHTRMSHK